MNQLTNFVKRHRVAFMAAFMALVEIAIVVVIDIDGLMQRGGAINQTVIVGIVVHAIAQYVKGSSIQKGISKVNAKAEAAQADAGALQAVAVTLIQNTAEMQARLDANDNNDRY